ncbi:MAG: amidohydrolase, partial [Bacilli bacterium]
MILIKNATIYPVSAPIIKDCDLLIEGKIIKEIGFNLSHDQAQIIDAQNLHVFPGFIDGHTHLGIGESSIGFEGRDYNEMSDPVTPQLRAIDAINPCDITFKEAYEAGITCVASGPGSANVVGGQYTCLKTYGTCVDQMLVKEVIGMKVAFGENPKRVYNEKNKMP